MKRFALTLLVLFSVSSLDAGTDPLISAVENGLRPALVFEGEDLKPWTLQERMEHYGVPGVGIAVIRDYRVAWFKTWGLADRDTGEAATAATLFQAGSISKPVSAFGALRMVETGQLSLDSDVNLALKSWSLPDNEFTTQARVNLKQLLSHTAGLTVHGFLGYAPGLPVPTLVQVLDGVAPANSDPIRVNKAPGGDYRYSGGGYTIAQQMMIDVSGKPFPALLDELVIRPVKMTRSTFQQPLPADWLQHAAAGVLPNGHSVPGKRHTYPEMAAAGLWATAGDLALFAIELQKALQGKSPLMSQAMARAMVTPVAGGYALGLAIAKHGDATYFGHEGWDEGFSSELIASLDDGYGAVVMTNSNHPDFINEVIQGIAAVYGWSGYENQQKLNIPEPLLIQAPGRYRIDTDLAAQVYAEDGRLFMRYTFESPVELFYLGEGRFMRREQAFPIMFTGSGDERLFNFVAGDELYTRALLTGDEWLPSEVLENQGLEAGISAYRKALEANPEESAYSEETINNDGLDLMQTNPDFGIALLRVNTALYPDSASTWDSVGYAYRQTGDLEKAGANYREALKRDPEFASARAALAEIAEMAETQKGMNEMSDSSSASTGATTPEYVSTLEAAYGGPSQAAFGSAVFCEPLPATASLEQAALARYQFFTGELWNRYGKDAWMGPWRQVYARPPGAQGDILTELSNLEDRGAALSASMLLDVEGGSAALAAAFDDAAVSELSVFTLGDGGAMSGVLVAARRQASEEAVFLVFLLD